MRTTLLAWAFFLGLNTSLCFGDDSLLNRGEELHYKLKWGIFKVGQATLKIHEDTEWNGIPCYRLSLFVRTNGFADGIYRIRTSVESYVTTDLKRTLYYSKRQKEGKTDRDITVDFDYDTMTAQYSNHGESQQAIGISDSTLDPLSVLFYYRVLGLKEGMESETIDVTDGKKLVQVEVHPEESEKVKLPFGFYQAVRVRPEVKDLGGVFEKSKKGKVSMWFSNDADNHLLRLSSKVIVGKFTAYLSEKNES